MRRNFVRVMEELLEKDKDIIIITVDVGFGVLEPLKEKFPENFLNLGISEQNTVSVATGMALKGKKPFVYSINAFLLFRALEQIRMLADMEQHVILVGVGLKDEYTNFGITHYAFGDEEILATMPITVLTPESKEDVARCVRQAYKGKGPYYLRLSRY